MNSLAALQSQIDGIVEDSGWINVIDFKLGISGIGLQYRKLRNRVFLRGKVTITYAEVEGGLFVLPVGFRPPVTTVLGNTQRNDGAYPGSAIVTTITDTGNVTGESINPAFTTAEIDFGGISFFIDN